jgi:hypothetical protein
VRSLPSRLARSLPSRSRGLGRAQPRGKYRYCLLLACSSWQLLDYEVLGWIGTAAVVLGSAVLYFAAAKLLDHEFVRCARLRDTRGANWVLATFLVVGAGYALAWAIGYRTAIRDANTRATTADPWEAFIPRLLDVELTPVVVQRVDGKPSGLKHPRLLGEADGTYVLIDDGRKTIRVPVGSGVVRTEWP